MYLSMISVTSGLKSVVRQTNKPAKSLPGLLGVQTTGIQRQSISVFSHTCKASETVNQTSIFPFPALLRSWGYHADSFSSSANVNQPETMCIPAPFWSSPQNEHCKTAVMFVEPLARGKPGEDSEPCFWASEGTPKLNHALQTVLRHVG